MKYAVLVKTKHAMYLESEGFVYVESMQEEEPSAESAVLSSLLQLNDKKVG